MRQSVCQYGHTFLGKFCPECKTASRAASRHDWVREKTRGEPDSVPGDDDWREAAACRYPLDGLDPDDWFAQQRTLADQKRLTQAKAVCEDCPVREPCLDYALATRQPFGVWGGKTADERGTAYWQQKAAG